MGVAPFLPAEDLHDGSDADERRLARREYIWRARAHLAIPRFAWRSGVLADHPPSAAEREATEQRLEPALAALRRAGVARPGGGTAYSEGAAKRFAEVATTAFFWRHTMRLTSTEHWDSVARRAVSDWAEVWASDAATVCEAAPRLGEAFFWASMDDPDAHLLYRAAVCATAAENEKKVSAARE